MVLESKIRLRLLELRSSGVHMYFLFLEVDPKFVEKFVFNLDVCTVFKHEYCTLSKEYYITRLNMLFSPTLPAKAMLSNAM